MVLHRSTLLKKCCTYSQITAAIIEKKTIKDEIVKERIGNREGRNKEKNKLRVGRKEGRKEGRVN